MLEALYRFPLPGDAAVTGVQVRFGSVEIDTELKERPEAEADYEKARQEGRVLRHHWRIEACWPWQLDSRVGEGGSRIPGRHGAANCALRRKLALSLLQRNPSKQSIARKRKDAALDPQFLEEVLAGATKQGGV